MVTLSSENRKRTLTQCYAHFGIDHKGKNIRRWWTDRAPDGKIVITLWTDHFLDQELTDYSIFNRPDISAWTDRYENRRRRILLESIGVGGYFQSIVQRYANPDQRPRAAKERYIGNPMRLTALNPMTGEFSAKEIQY